MPSENQMFSLFWEEISVCAAVHVCYVMDVCDCMESIILLPPMMRTSFVLIVSELKHLVI